jgi:uncharacterized protein
MISAESLVKKYSLRKHPEGGYYKECYRSSDILPRKALPSRYKGDRNCSTSILYLLRAGSISRLHKLNSDEVWHFYLGGPLELLQITPSGKSNIVLLGQDVAAGQKVQYVVPAGHWFGARPARRTVYSFVGCTVAPGFDFADFELANPEDLSSAFPALKEKILSFSR